MLSLTLLVWGCQGNKEHPLCEIPVVTSVKEEERLIQTSSKASSNLGVLKPRVEETTPTGIHLDFSSTAKTSLLCLIFSLWWSWCTTEAITSTPTPGTKCAPSSCCYLHYTDDRFFPSANHQIVSNKVMSQGPQSNINDAALLLLLHHLFTFLSNSDDHLLKNIELFDRLSLSFNSRVLFIKDVIGDEICCWSFYGQGRKLAEVCCTSIVYATEKKQTKVRGRWPFYMVCPETQTEVL